MDDFTRALMQLLAYLNEREEHRLGELRRIFGPRTFVEGINFERKQQGRILRWIAGAFGAGMGAMMMLVVAVLVIGKTLGARLVL